MLPSTPSGWRPIGTDLLALLLAADCAGCDQAGTLLCDRCRELLRPAPVDVRTHGGLEVRAALPYDGPAARCIRRLKDRGETLVARPLGAALGAVLHAALAQAPGAIVIPIPTTRAAFRRRGFRVTELLVARAGATPHRLLCAPSPRRDQRGLDAAARAQNVRGRLTATAEGAGRTVILVDDVVTTGATFDEAARAIRYAGFRVLTGIALAATPHHGERRVNASETRRK